MKSSKAPSIGASDHARQEEILQMISALGQHTRLEVFRLLASEGDTGMVAGQIAKVIGAPHNTLSTHLAILQRAGLISSTRQGRNITYNVVPDCLKDVIGFLLSECSQSLQQISLPDDLLAQLRNQDETAVQTPSKDKDCA